jgi:hypothetical protein
VDYKKLKLYLTVKREKEGREGRRKGTEEKK